MEITSTFKTTIDEFCEVANWMTQNIYNWRNLDSDQLNQIKIKLDALQPIADKYDRSFRTTTVILEKELYLKLENASSSLWNAISITLKTEQQTRNAELKNDKPSNSIGNKTESNLYLLCCCKRFVAVLFSVHDALVNTVETHIRTLNCHVNTLKSVIDCLTQEFLTIFSLHNGEVDVELESKYNSSKIKNSWNKLLKNCQDSPQPALKLLEDNNLSYNQVQLAQINKHKLEYFLVNFQICLQDGDIQTAKLYSSKINIKENPSTVDANSLIELCRIIFNSVLIYSKKCQTINEKYEVTNLLKLGLEYLDLPIQELTTHINYQNIKYSITLFLTKFSVENYPNVVNENDCDILVNKLQEEFGKKTEPYKLAIRYFQTKNNESCDQIIQEIIMRMVTSINVTIYWEQILECIGKLASNNTSLAIICMEYIFINKLNPQKDTKIWEDLIVARVFMTVEAKDMTIEDITTSLQTFFELVESKSVNKLSKLKISCIVTLLWNLGKRLDKNKDYSKSCKIYELAERDLFCDDFADIGKISRALISSYINCHEYNSALQQYKKMSEKDKMHPLTQLLLLKIYMVEKERENILCCFNNICLSEEKNSLQILILGVSLCKELDDMIIVGINLLFEKLKSEPESLETTQSKEYNVPLLELIRYTLQLTIKLLEEDDSNWDKYFVTIQSLLNKGKTIVANRLQRKGMGSQIMSLDEESISVDEIEWFASIAYNLSVKGYNIKKTNDLLTLVQIALDFNKMIPLNQFSFSKQCYFELWNYRTIIVKGKILLENNQQTESNITLIEELIILLEKSLQEISIFKNNSQEEVNGDILNDLDTCKIEIISLEFESIMHLKTQQRLKIFTEKVLEYKNSKIDKALIELCSNNLNCPPGMIKHVIITIIKRNLTMNTVSNNDLCNWLKILLENISNPGDTIDEDIVSNVLKKFQLDTLNDNTCLKDCKENIEIVSTLVWNVGVNLIISNNKKSATKWCKNSICFAKLVNEGLTSQLKSMWYSLLSNTGIEDSEIDEI